jgi:hypothetical protein
MDRQNAIYAEVRLSLRDLFYASLVITFRRLRWGFAALSAIAAIGLILLCWLVASRRGEIDEQVSVIQNLLPLVFLFLIMPVFMVIGAFFSSRSLLKNNPIYQGTCQYSFSDDGISFSGPHAQGTLQWTGLTRGGETNKTFLLYQDASRALVLPKRFFSTESDAGAFREMVRRRLPRSRLRE